MTLSPLGDSAIVISLGERTDAAMAVRVRAIVEAIERHRPAGVVDVVGAFASVAVFFDPTRGGGYDGLRTELEARVARADETTVTVDAGHAELPVCYGGEFGPDLAELAARLGKTEAEVIALHAGAEYVVHAIGFAPGFPYLGGLPASLATPRRATPRTKVPAGSVGIGGAQAGIYPFATPGGWNLLGRTPVALFDPGRTPPARLRVGERVRFLPISGEEFSARSAAVAQALTDSHGGGRDSEVVDAAAGAIDVLRAGMLTTVQDPGRAGYRAAGVPLSGAADPFALRIANLLVGNPEDAAGLEFTLTGPELRFSRDAVVALGGGDFGVPRWRPLRIRAGETLKLDRAITGCRGYLAVSGGVRTPEVMGSRSTYLRAGFGGLAGRGLRNGDRLPAPLVHREFGGRWRVDERILPECSANPVVRIIAGEHGGEFEPGWQTVEFGVSPHSDRMGLRLQGHPVRRTTARELVSAPVAPGTIQVPPDGQPIVLLADAQTIGGYPRLAHVIAVDLPLVAQLRPGDRVRFRAVTLVEAHELLLARERALGMLREGLAQKVSG